MTGVVGAGQDTHIVKVPVVADQNMRIVKAGACRMVGMAKLGARYNIDSMGVGARQNMGIERVGTGHHMWERLGLCRPGDEKLGTRDFRTRNQTRNQTRRRRGYSHPWGRNLGFELAKQRANHGQGCCTEGKKTEEVE